MLRLMNFSQLLTVYFIINYVSTSSTLPRFSLSSNKKAIYENFLYNNVIPLCNLILPQYISTSCFKTTKENYKLEEIKTWSTLNLDMILLQVKY